MSNSLDGLQFPLLETTQKPSTSHTGKAIISEALSIVDNKLSQQALNEKQWRKQYPVYFRALVEHGIRTRHQSVNIAQQGLHKVHHSFVFYRDGIKYLLKDVMNVANVSPLHSVTIKGESQDDPEWYVPYGGKKLTGQALLTQIQDWETRGIIEPSHAKALRLASSHPEWFDLSDRTMVLFGAASEAGPLTWLSKWRANIVAVDLPNPKVWEKILDTVRKGNAKLIAPCVENLDAGVSSADLKHKLGANLLTQLPEVVTWLNQFKSSLDLAAIAYLDGEKHVRVSMAMDTIMSLVSEHKPDSSLMFMCTPTDIYAVPKEVVEAAHQKAEQRSNLQKVLTAGIKTLTLKHFFQSSEQALIRSDNDKHYGVADCLVLEQGPNYALAKRIQQWRAIWAHQNGQRVSINIAPSTTTHSVTKNPILKAAFNGASLFDVEAFAPETTNAIMAALWVHDLRNDECAANPHTSIDHPLELMMEGANHGGLWRVAYLARTALPFAALYGFASDKLPLHWLKK